MRMVRSLAQKRNLARSSGYGNQRARQRSGETGRVVHRSPDVWVVRGRDSVTVLLTNHVLPRHPMQSESIHIQLTGLLSPRDVYVERINNDHANAKKLWVEMGSPTLPRPREVEQLGTASQIEREARLWKHEGDTLHLGVTMPAHAIAASAVELTPRRSHEDAR